MKRKKPRGLAARLEKQRGSSGQPHLDSCGEDKDDEQENCHHMGTARAFLKFFAPQAIPWITLVVILLEIGDELLVPLAYFFFAEELQGPKRKAIGKWKKRYSPWTAGCRENEVAQADADEQREPCFGRTRSEVAGVCQPNNPETCRDVYQRPIPWSDEVGDVAHPFLVPLVGEIA